MSKAPLRVVSNASRLPSSFQEGSPSKPWENVSSFSDEPSGRTT